MTARPHRENEEYTNHHSRTQLLYASQIIYASAIMTAKLSILALYWRLFPTVFMKRGCAVLAALTIMWWAAGVLVDIFQCTPVGQAFNVSSGGSHGDSCISQVGYCLGMIIPNILIDVMILCLPTFEVAKLHLPRSQRAALASVFLLGAGVTSAGGVRMYYHLELVQRWDKGNFDFTCEFTSPHAASQRQPKPCLYNTRRSSADDILGKWTSSCRSCG